MKKQLIQVSLKDFKLSELLLAADEGRLYYQPREASPEQMREEGIQAILRYVSRINDCASATYLSRVAECWESMLRHPRLSDLFFYAHKIRQRDTPNYYRVNAIVFILREKGIYRKEDFTNSALHCLLEGTPTRTNIYSGVGYYYPNEQERKLILQLFGCVR